MVQKFISDKGECSSCNQSTNITDFETGEVFCGQCGYVLSDHVEDSGPEWRSFSDDKINKERTGSVASSAKHDQGLSTILV